MPDGADVVHDADVVDRAAVGGGGRGVVGLVVLVGLGGGAGLRFPGSQLLALLGLDRQPDVVLHPQMCSISLPGAKSQRAMITLEIPDVFVNQNMLGQGSLLSESTTTAVLRTEVLETQVLFGVEVLGVGTVVMSDQITDDFETPTTDLASMGKLGIGRPMVANVVLDDIGFVAESLTAHFARDFVILTRWQFVQAQLHGQLLELVIRDGGVGP